jgi:acyl-homoserine-lactone acylase
MSNGPRRRAAGWGAALVLAALTVVAAPAAARASSGHLHAKIERTKYGVPHITAPSFAGLGFGFGYAFAKDNLCTIADSYVTVDAQRSRYFGPDESWVFAGNGTVNNNLDSDFFYGAINKSGIVEDLVSRKAPDGPAPHLKDLVNGYVAGYNRYLRRTGVNNLPDPRCRGADWVRPIHPIQVYRRFYQLGGLASTGAVIEGISTATPTAGLQAQQAEAKQSRAIDALSSGELDPKPFPLASGSNAIGLGSDATANGRGMLLGNPHFPWSGSERLYQVQLHIPGKLNVEGGTLYGVPAVEIGHTNGLAWSHTVASAWRFTPFELTLPPGDPHSYIVDGQIKPMTATDVTVKAKTDGGLENRSRTLYSTEYGPMFNDLEGIPFPWTPLKAYAMGDVNSENFRYLNHFLATDQAQSVPQYDRIERRIEGIPWVNSIAADRKGRAYYTMDGAIPNVPDSKATSCAGSIGIPVFQATGIPVLDGSRSACNWDSSPDAATPGILPPSEIPTLIRRDYVENSNDSHWLTNPEHPLTGFPRIVGDQNTERSLRTRLGLTMIRERLAGTDGLPGKGFTLKDLTKITLNDRQYAGELWRDQLVGFCDANPTLTGSNGPVDVSGACPVLAAWNVHDDLDSNGAILFRRFVSNLLSNFQFIPSGTDGGQYVGLDSVFTTPFDAQDAVDTPSGLDTSNPAVGQALADAVDDLDSAGIPLDAPLRGYQYVVRNGDKIPIPGGPGALGDFNAINDHWTPPAGYPDVPHGSSFITAVSFTNGRCPVKARTFVTYSESENPDSPHASDYTRAFSHKRWNHEAFCGFQIRHDPHLRVQRVGR